MHISFAGGTMHKLLVERNAYIKNEYDNYLNVNRSNGRSSRFWEWLFLLRLNIAYFILNRNSNSDKKVFNDIDIINSRPDSESVVSPNNKRVHWLAMEMMKYEIISFDIFDTLLFRPFDSPKSVFILVGEKLGVHDFYRIRIDAEKVARELHYENCGNREINICDIYSVIEKWTGIPTEVGVDAEFQCELDLCYANPYMLQLYKILICQGKRILIVTDMYLLEHQIEKLLKKNGFTAYDSLYISNKTQLSKGVGNLFEYVLLKENCAREALLHIDDNKNAINKANKLGIATKYYCNVNLVGNKFRPNNMSFLFGSAYRGIINAKLQNGLVEYSPQYEYGYTIGGIYVLGYVNWIKKICYEKKCSKIIFLSRDGYIYKKIFDEFINNEGIFQTEYLLWSRIAAEFVNINMNKHSYINTFVKNRYNGKSKITIKELLQAIGADCILEYLSDYTLSEDTYLCDENQKIITNIIINHWNEIVTENKEKMNSLVKYIAKIVGKSEKVAIVDVGWSGNNISLLKQAINENMEVNEVICFLAGNTNSLDIKENMNCYMFSDKYNRTYFEKHTKSKVPSNNLFELFTQEKKPSFRYIDNDEFKYEIPEVENYKYIDMIHKGIQDFAADWTKYFAKYEFMTDIEGCDAYCPFDFIKLDTNWYINNLGDFTMSMKAVSDTKSFSVETLKQILGG